jgi:hypothetical protein
MLATAMHAQVPGAQPSHLRRATASPQSLDVRPCTPFQPCPVTAPECPSDSSIAPLARSSWQELPRRMTLPPATTIQAVATCFAPRRGGDAPLRASRRPSPAPWPSSWNSGLRISASHLFIANGAPNLPRGPNPCRSGVQATSKPNAVYSPAASAAAQKRHLSRRVAWP